MFRSYRVASLLPAYAVAEKQQFSIVLVGTETKVGFVATTGWIFTKLPFVSQGGHTPILPAYGLAT